MRLLADESVDRAIVQRLRDDGHDVPYVAEMEPGIDDQLVLHRANAAGAVLLTQDKDFGELVHRQGLLSYGIVLIRLAGLGAELKSTIVSRAIADHGTEMAGSFAVVSPAMVRIRR